MAWIFLTALAPSAWAGTVTVTSGTTYQTISGFGASSQWVESKITAALATIFWTDDSSQTPANQVNGHVGLSIIRIGIDDSGNGNWGTAAGSATQALKINANVKVFGSEWSPPAKWKNNNSVDGNGTGNDNFNPGTNTSTIITADLPQYATYLTSFATACKNTYGFTPYAVSPQNEPDYDPTYDACLWTPQQFDTLIGTYLGPDLAAAGFTNTMIMTPESFADNLTGSNTTMVDANAAKYVNVIGMHLYGGGPTTVPASYSTTAGHNVESWCTEISEKTSGANENTMPGAMTYADQIHNCIVDHNFNAYCYWWLVNENTDDEGLCTSAGNPTPTLYVLGNFSKFIRPGYVRIGATEAPSAGVSVSAYYSASAGKVVIVAINNNTSTQSQTFNYSDLNISTVYPWITDSALNLVQQTAVAVSGGSFTYTLPAQSVVSFVASVTTSSTTSTPTPTSTSTRSATPTATSTPTKTPTPTSSPTPTASKTSTSTGTPTATSSPTVTAMKTSTPTSTPTVTLTFTGTSTATSTMTKTATLTPTGTPTSTPSFTATATATPTVTRTATTTATVTQTLSPTNTATITLTPVLSFTFTSTATITLTSTVTPTPTVTRTSTATSTSTYTATATPTASSTNSPTATLTPLFTFTFTATPAVTSTNTATASYTATPTPTDTASSTNSPTDTLTPVFTFTSTPTATVTRTFTGTPTPTHTVTPTATFTPSATMTATAIPTIEFFQQASNSNPNPGEAVTYSLSITVSGGSAGQAAVTDILPANLTFDQFTPGDPIGTQSGQTIIWDLSGLMPGNYTLSFSASVGSTVAGGTVFLTQGNIYFLQSNNSYFASSAVTVVALTSTPTATFTPTPTASATRTPIATSTPTDTSTPATSVPVIYPNPVDGTKPVSIYVTGFTGTADVTVEIFTTSFRKVQTHVYDNVSAGGSVPLSLTDNWGRPLANGLYYVEVITPRGRSILKLLIVR